MNAKQRRKAKRALINQFMAGLPPYRRDFLRSNGPVPAGHNWTARPPVIFIDECTEMTPALWAAISTP